MRLSPRFRQGLHLSRRQLISGSLSAALLSRASQPLAPSLFEPTWGSLKRYRCPDWFRDSKLGIFLHWGPQSVPGVDPWYAREMYVEGHATYTHHVNTYGHPSKFGYKDIIALWKAEKFDPDHLVAGFRKAGARYIVPVAVHHDNFDNWDSKHHRWNSVNFGPRKDIVGMWKKAALKYGLRFGVSEHLERSYSWFNTNKGSDQRGPLAGVPYDGNDPRYSDLYFEPHPDTSDAYPGNPPNAWKHQWLSRILDLVDSYQPDLLYTDGGLPFHDYGLKLVAHFYNQNLKSHKGRLEAVYTIKNMAPRADHGEFVDGVCVEDLERGVLDRIKPEPWQTDTCIGEWFYMTERKYKSAGSVIHTLVDIVSKNGNLLLNIPLKPEGDLDSDAERFLAEFSEWMQVNAEAIHGTRPWKVFGEGPTHVAAGQFAENKTPAFTPMDVRFTAKGNTLYAISLGVPSKELFIRALGAKSPLAPARIARIAVLGVQESLRWERLDEGLRIELPAGHSLRHATAIRITMGDGRDSGRREAAL